MADTRNMIELLTGSAAATRGIVARVGRPITMLVWDLRGQLSRYDYATPAEARSAAKARAAKAGARIKDQLPTSAAKLQPKPAAEPAKAAPGKNPFAHLVRRER